MAAVVDTLVEACPTTAPTSGSPWAARPTWPGSATASTPPSGPLLEALEEHVVLLKLLGEAHAGGAVTVRIGDEGPYQELASTSVVATGYGPGDDALATLGIVGPTRMDYPGRWPPCAPSPATCPGSSTRHETRDRATRPTTDEGPNLSQDLYDLLGVPATRTPTPSRRPTGGWPGSCTPT